MKYALDALDVADSLDSLVIMLKCFSNENVKFFRNLGDMCLLSASSLCTMGETFSPIQYRSSKLETCS
jgi:hypothetical protein